MFFVIRKITEPMMINQAKLFPSNYTNRVVHLSTALLQSIAGFQCCSSFKIDENEYQNLSIRIKKE